MNSRAEYQRNYQQKNKERLKNYRADYYQQNREKISEKRKAQRVRNLYIVTAPEGKQKTFISIKELAVFFGYSYRYFQIKLKNNKEILGYKIEKTRGIK